MVTHTYQETIGPAPSIPDAGMFTATSYWTGGLHWTHYRPTTPRAGAKTLVFIHGAGHNEYVWTLGDHNWVSVFTELGHDVITISLSGHRPSRGIVAIQTLGRYLRDAHTPVEVLGLADEEVVYIGHSMGGLVSEGLLARYPRTAGSVVVDNVALHHNLAAYQPVIRRLFRCHPRTALAALVSPAAIFGSDTLVRELLLGQEASDALVVALRSQLGGETAMGMPTMLAAKFRGRLPLDGQKLLFLSARHSAFYPTCAIEASARAYGARCVVVDGPHNLMMTASGALQGAQAIATFLASLPAPAQFQQEGATGQ